MGNAHKITTGNQESPLSELGRHQVRIAADKLNHLEIDLIVCSPLDRALNSAKIVAETLQYPIGDIRVINELSERHLGELEGRSYASNDKISGNTVEVESAKDVEPIDQFHSRIYAAFREITTTRHHRNVLVVCHQNVARMLQVIAHNREPMAMYDIPRIENAQIIRLI